MRTSNRASPLTLTLAAFAATGVLLLIGVVAPSWASIGLYHSDIAVTSSNVSYPASLRRAEFGDFSDIVDRPLFNADRKKDPAAAASGPAQRLALDAYRLAGVVTAGPTRIALVERRATKTIITLKVGETLDGRTVKDITTAGVIFGGPVEETLTFPKASGTGTTALSGAGGPQNRVGKGEHK